MIRLFYDSITGNIKTMATVDVALNLNNDPYIDHDDDSLKINQWRVDLDTKTLVRIAEPLEPITR